MADNSKSAKSGRNSKKPSHQRYKASDRLRKRKLRNLMRVNRLTRATAMDVLDGVVRQIPVAEQHDQQLADLLAARRLANRERKRRARGRGLRAVDELTAEAQRLGLYAPAPTVDAPTLDERAPGGVYPEADGA